MIRLSCFLACLVVTVSCRQTLDAPAVSCSKTRAFSAPWHELSDSELHQEIDRACGHVSVGFKEVHAARGVDARGRSLTSDTTVSRMKRLLAERGVMLEWESRDMPHLSGWMPVRLDLVSELRHHPNVDYLEPLFPGSWNARR